MRRLTVAMAVAAYALANAALAQGSDRDKPLHYEADAGECDDIKQVCTLVGNVILVKGTMRATGERVQIRKDPAGYQYGTITVPPGQLATFRQRRDGPRADVEEYIEGYGERIEYDERADTVKLQTRARIRLLEDGVQRDELRGNSITYDQRNARYFVEGGKPSADPASPDGRVRGTIAPRSPAPPAAAAPGKLNPSRQLANPPRE
jgi:lipopolysaccharide export system protein LptA